MRRLFPIMPCDKKGAEYNVCSAACPQIQGWKSAGKRSILFSNESCEVTGMEEVRSFGYLCPQCGKAVLGSRSAFALSAAAARIECECGRSELDVETDGVKFHLRVPCGLCGGEHEAVCRADELLRGRGVGLACPETKQLCCYAGAPEEVRRHMEELALRARKEKADDPGAFTDNVIMYEVLSELKEIAARGGISCTCGSREYRIQVRRMCVDFTCAHCGGKLRLDAATDEDLDRLCCQMRLTIRGKA